MPRFLEPLASVGTPMLINARTGRSVASSVEIATTRRQRRRGLIGRDGLCAGSAFVLAPCWAVHTIGMRFPIDVVFVDDEGTVVKMVEHMEGWRMAAARDAAITIELWAGALKAVDLAIGDRLCLAPAFGEALAFVSPRMASAAAPTYPGSEAAPDLAKTA